MPRRLRDYETKRIVEALVEVSDDIKNNRSPKFVYIIKTMAELVIIYIILTSLTSHKKAMAVLYFMFAQRTYAYVDKFHINI